VPVGGEIVRYGVDFGKQMRLRQRNAVSFLRRYMAQLEMASGYCLRLFRVEGVLLDVDRDHCNSAVVVK
jgi:hypothetical protein